jgi:hypothetical protein
MPKRASIEPDPNLFAKRVVDNLIAKYDPESPEAAAIRNASADELEPEDTGKNPAAVALGKLGGRKGGLARAANLSPAKRKQIAKKAARARWSKSK